MSFDCNKHAYPETFIINGNEFQGAKKTGNNQVKIPFTFEPEVELGTIITQIIGQREFFKSDRYEYITQQNNADRDVTSTFTLA